MDTVRPVKKITEAEETGPETLMPDYVNTQSCSRKIWCQEIADLEMTTLQSLGKNSKVPLRNE